MGGPPRLRSRWLARRRHAQAPSMSPRRRLCVIGLAPSRPRSRCIRTCFVACIAIFAASDRLVAAPAARAGRRRFVVRLNRLEGQFRQMSGQIEQLQFENRQLKDQLRKFQEDVEFRFQEAAAARRPAPASPPARDLRSRARLRAQPPRATAPRRCLRPRRRSATRPARRCRSAPRRPSAPLPPTSRRGRAGPMAAARRRHRAGTDRSDPDRARTAPPRRGAPLDLSRRRTRRRRAPRSSRAAPERRRDGHAAMRAPTTTLPMRISCSGNTSRPRWAFASSCSRIRATGSCPTRPTGSARAISSAAARARRPSSS